MPPPLHGFSAVNAAMLERLRQRYSVVVFDRAPSRSSHAPHRFQDLLNWARLLCRFTGVLISQRPSVLYVGLSGGRGQWLDLPFCILGRLAGLRAVIHHHSFAYLDRRYTTAAICFRVLSGATHLALCPEMRRLLTLRYSIDEVAVRVLSNISFLPKQSMQLVESLDEKALTIGFLSNITSEKGIFEFFDTLHMIRAAGVPFKAIIGGPISPQIDLAFKAALAAMPMAEHVGPVYGEAKWKFLLTVDLLLFPSKYANEAEPLTLWEAFQAGAQVLATRLGCICHILTSAGAHNAVVSIEGFSQAAVEMAREFATLNQSERIARRCKIQAFYDREFMSNADALEGVVRLMQPQDY